MPRTRKMYAWNVTIENITVTVRAKTYKGACYKVFRKLNRSCVKLFGKYYKHPKYDAESGTFANVICVRE